MSTKTPRPFIPYSIPLGNRQFARLVLPHDLSTAEAERICGVIRTLAFTDEELAAADAATSRRRESLGALMAEWAAADAGNPVGQPSAAGEDEGP